MKNWKLIGIIVILLNIVSCNTRVSSSSECQLVFSSERKEALNEDIGYDIYLMDCDGENKVQLTDNLWDDDYPDYAPDGKQIVFESNRDGNREIYIMNEDGSEQRNFSNHPANDRWPAWSPDGKWIAFASDREDIGDYEIYIQELEGGEIYQITDDFFDDVDPAWSPDGDKLAYVQWNCPRNKLVIVSLEDLSFEEVGLNMGCISNIDWSPNGFQISYDTSVGKDLDIFVVTIEGRGVDQLTKDYNNQTLMNAGAAWSPDGSQIAYIHAGLVSYSEIYIMNSDGSENRMVTDEGVWISALDWRP